MLLAVAAWMSIRARSGDGPALLAEVEAGERAVEQDRRRVALEVADLAEDLVAAERLGDQVRRGRAGARGSAPGGSDAPPAWRPRAPAPARRPRRVDGNAVASCATGASSRHARLRSKSPMK